MSNGAGLSVFPDVVAVYPTSLELEDLDHDFTLVEAPYELVTDRPDPACALCAAGLCTQRVERFGRKVLVVHALERAAHAVGGERGADAGKHGFQRVGTGRDSGEYELVVFPVTTASSLRVVVARVDDVGALHGRSIPHVNAAAALSPRLHVRPEGHRRVEDIRIHRLVPLGVLSPRPLDQGRLLRVKPVPGL